MEKGYLTKSLVTNPLMELIHYLQYANNGKERLLAKIFLGANDVCEAACTQWSQVFFLLREGRGVGYLLFPIWFP
jgi:hypothetical protein